jgi:sorting nexin-1/2
VKRQQEKKTPTNTTTTFETSADQEKKSPEQDKIQLKVDDDEDDDIFGVKSAPPLAVPVQVPVAIPEPQSPSPKKQESELYPVDTNVNSPQPARSTIPFESQLSSSTPKQKSILTESLTTNKPVQKRSDDHNIEITVSDPTKVGEGMSSYMIYRITTKTTLPIFKKSDFTVNRRFSDFLGLHSKLAQKHLHMGIFIPSPPEKDSLSMAKVKISKEEAVPTDFIDRRRSQLERYLNRLARHDKLIEDSDVREFLEMPNDLPK